jgi:hypothetical protein
MRLFILFFVVVVVVCDSLETHLNVTDVRLFCANEKIWAQTPLPPMRDIFFRKLVPIDVIECKLATRYCFVFTIARSHWKCVSLGCFRHRLIC